MPYTDTLDLELLYRELTERACPVLPVARSSTAGMIEIQAAKLTPDQKGTVCSADGQEVEIIIFPLLFQSDPQDERGIQKLIQVRKQALRATFEKWTNTGFNKRDYKNPYRCRAFNKYLAEIGYDQAEWVVIAV